MTIPTLEGLDNQPAFLVLVDDGLRWWELKSPKLEEEERCSKRWRSQQQP